MARVADERWSKGGDRVYAAVCKVVIRFGDKRTIWNLYVDDEEGVPEAS